MMNHEERIGLLLEACSLKRVPRSGWLLRGVPHVESVADHSFGVAWLAIVLLDALGPGNSPLDREKVLLMALLHDLAELRLTDLPATATRLIPEAVKSEAEASAVASLLAPLAGGEGLRALWQEFEEGTSAEGRLVRDADKLEMMIQCLRYEQAGSRGLDEFWQGMDRRAWHFPLCAELYGRLRAQRPAGAAAQA
jgi:putative hydrolases of HD superfamily